MVDLERFRGERIRPLHADEYETLVAGGSFQDEAIELLDGVLVAVTPIGEPHAAITTRLHRRLVITSQHLDVDVRCQCPIRMGDYSMPEPDLAVVARERDFVRPSSALLIVEVSDSSGDKDRHTKSRIYANANVPEYWIVDVRHEQVEVYRDPHGTKYRSLEVIERGGVLRPVELAGVEVTVEDLFRTS